MKQWMRIPVITNVDHPVNKGIKKTFAYPGIDSCIDYLLDQTEYWIPEVYRQNVLREPEPTLRVLQLTWVNQKSKEAKALRGKSLSLIRAGAYEFRKACGAK